MLGNRAAFIIGGRVHFSVLPDRSYERVYSG